MKINFIESLIAVIVLCLIILIGNNIYHYSQRVCTNKTIVDVMCGRYDCKVRFSDGTIDMIDGLYLKGETVEVCE